MSGALGGSAEAWLGLCGVFRDLYLVAEHLGSPPPPQPLGLGLGCA